jgi:small subunit ribosomal protein S1
VPSAITRPPATTAPRARVQLDADTEQEIEAALAELNQDALEGAPRSRFAGRAKPQAKSPGGARRGRVISVSGDNIFVDMGGKSEGVISAMQFPEGPPAVGSDVELIIDHFDAAEGLLILRRPGAAQEADWSTIKEGMIVEGRVTAAAKSGLVLEMSGIRAFMPASLIDIARVEDLDSFIGQTLRCQVSEVKRSERNVILSRRALIEAEREAAREKTWAELAEGQTRTGTVRNIKEFGAFVDLGGIDGLVPVREMSWAPVKDVGEVVRLGQQVQVKVLRIDRETRKITLGLKQLQASPWETLEQRLPIGSNVTGRVTKLMDFGAFVELEPGIEGLVHISELAHQRVRRVRDVVQEGQMLPVQILKIDAEQRRIALSHKATIEKAAPEPEPEEPESPDPPPAPKPPRKTPLKGGLGR